MKKNHLDLIKWGVYLYGVYVIFMWVFSGFYFVFGYTVKIMILGHLNTKAKPFPDFVSENINHPLIMLIGIICAAFVVRDFVKYERNKKL